jgi:hypothetical protein
MIGKRPGCAMIDKNQSAFWAENSPAPPQFWAKLRFINAFGMVRQGELEKRDFKNNTFKAGMYMKTNKPRSRCPEKIRHLRLSFGHFRQTGGNLAGKSGSAMAICNFNLVLHGFSCA